MTDFECDEEFWMNFVEIEKPRYCIMGREVCPDSGENHLQCYVYFDNARSFEAIRKKMTPRHIEGAKGSPTDNKTYCSKENNFEEWGECPKQGRRVDLEDMRRRIKEEGLTDTAIAEENYESWLHYRKGHDAYRAKVEKKRNWKTEVIVCWGPTGTGKSKAFWDGYGNREYEVADCTFTQGGFIGGYDGEDVVIFDDFNDTLCSMELFLRLTDRRQYRINVKGGFRNWKPKCIYITSNTNPLGWYGGDECVQRRISKIIHRKVKIVINDPEPYDTVIEEFRSIVGVGNTMPPPREPPAEDGADAPEPCGHSDELPWDPENFNKEDFYDKIVEVQRQIKKKYPNSTLPKKGSCAR